jgi:antitoxin (DNA-binding transcriptional repressor) of toxin-antitoxin stability system
MIKVTTHEAKTQLSRLIRKILGGEEVLICRGDQPAAKLVPVDASSPRECSRPPVGTITSAPIKYQQDVFSPLTAEELREWGI